MGKRIHYDWDVSREGKRGQLVRLYIMHFLGQAGKALELVGSYGQSC